MQNTSRKLLAVAFAALLGISALESLGRAQKTASSTSAQVPKTWNDEAIALLEVPLADPAHSPVHVLSDYYYRMPVRPVYKSYPIYAPGKEPPGYIESLKQQEPEIVFDAATLETEADWTRAGELVYDAAISASPLAPEFYEKTRMPMAKDGRLPFQRYVVRKKGTVELGMFSCAECHTRVMPDGTVVKGAQGNFPSGVFNGYQIRKRVAQTGDQGKQQLALFRSAQRGDYGAPWIEPNPGEEFLNSMEEGLLAREVIPPGVFRLPGTSIRYAAQASDLIGVKERGFLDHTGLVQHRSLGDLMCYMALHWDTRLLARYGDFIPAGKGKDFRELPDPGNSRFSRYSDEQLYALALYIYSLKPSANPNSFDARAARGKKVFERARCGDCHVPPLYTNNKLTPVDGFAVPEEHRKKYEIMPTSVGTDSALALRTRKGTGYYKVPSLKGAWHRGPFEHNGSVATLEDWFDPRRLRDDYVPTGYNPYGLKTRAVKGHAFGLELSAEDRKALIAFLKTL